MLIISTIHVNPSLSNEQTLGGVSHTSFGGGPLLYSHLLLQHHHQFADDMAVIVLFTDKIGCCLPTDEGKVEAVNNQNWKV